MGSIEHKSFHEKTGDCQTVLFSLADAPLRYARLVGCAQQFKLHPQLDLSCLNLFHPRHCDTLKTSQWQKHGGGEGGIQRIECILALYGLALPCSEPRNKGLSGISVFARFYRGEPKLIRKENVAQQAEM